MGIADSPLWREREPHCEYCRVFLTIHSVTRDHIHPKSLGGGRGDNLALACQPCNMRKGSMSAIDFLNTPWLKNRRIAVLKGEIKEAPRIKRGPQTPQSSSNAKKNERERQEWVLSSPRVMTEAELAREGYEESVRRDWWAPRPWDVKGR